MIVFKIVMGILLAAVFVYWARFFVIHWKLKAHFRRFIPEDDKAVIDYRWHRIPLFPLMLLVLILSGCGMDIDRNAVRIDLVFYEPESFPFMKLYRLERDEEGGFSSARITSKTEEEIKELLDDGYRKKYLTFARIYLYTLDTDSKQWIPVDQYSIFYAWFPNDAKWWFGQGILYPVKREKYYPHKAVLTWSQPGYPYASMTSTKLILDFRKLFSVTMKIVVVPSDGSAEARYWITHITREDIRINAEDYFKEKSLFDWRISIPEAKIILPPWSKWHIEPNPPKPTIKWEPPPNEINIRTPLPRQVDFTQFSFDNARLAGYCNYQTTGARYYDQCRNVDEKQKNFVG